MDCRWQTMLLGICLIFLSIAGLSQEKSESVRAVRLRDPSRPALVKVNLLNGSIRVKAYDGKEVIVGIRAENGGAPPAIRSGEDTGQSEQPEGSLKGLKVEEDDNVVSIKAGPVTGTVNLSLQVPVKTSLKLACAQAGEILVEKVEGEIEVSGLNGSVRLLDISGVVLAHNLNGQLKVTFQRITPGKPMSFSTLNGDIDVTLPANTRATVKLETLNGSIQNDFEIQPAGGPRPANARGLMKAEDQPVWTTGKIRSGTINGGGPEFRFKAFNGSIHIRKTKKQI